MSHPKASVRKAGHGPAILCLHSSTSSSKQWTALTELLSHSNEIVAPDLYGYGDSPAWDFSRSLSLSDELELLRPTLDSICGPFHLIGHSYGAAVALTLAHDNPTRIRSLTLYEPVLFNLLFEGSDASDTVAEVRTVRDDVIRFVNRGALHNAGRRFVDYWSGDGVWDKFEDWQRDSVAKRMPKVVADFDAVCGHTTPLTSYRELDIPTLLLYGIESPESTRRIVDVLSHTLPKAEVRGFLGMGHMGPITHAEKIAQLIGKFLEAQPRGILVHQLRRSRGRQGS
jgi:pimeloyl-ACP methyl ester carboxylesterase